MSELFFTWSLYDIAEHPIEKLESLPARLWVVREDYVFED
jgi:hypothetical protein